jgi:hypothetical protein
MSFNDFLSQQMYDRTAMNKQEPPRNINLTVSRDKEFSHCCQQSPGIFGQFNKLVIRNLKSQKFCTLTSFKPA